MSANELVWASEQFPMGAPIDENVGNPQAAFPFGLRYAVTPPSASVVQIDFSKISYDAARQISVVAEDDGSVTPAMKHTSTVTKTSTASHDRTGDDKDTDSSGR
jgi:putative ATP-grasp target RiPP